MIFIYAFLLFMASLVAAQGPGGNNEHSTNQTKCCECVPYTECNDGHLINPSKVSKPGQQTKVNVVKCEQLVYFCCLVPNLPSNCNSFLPGPKAKFIIDNEYKETCECTSWELCYPDKVVTDGKGPPSDKGLLTHSKCQTQSDVCCQSSPGHENAEPKGCVCVPEEQCVNGNVNTDGVGILEKRIGDNNNCPNHGDVCCKVPENGVGNIKNENYLALTFLVTLVSVLKGILTFQ